MTSWETSRSTSPSLRAKKLQDEMESLAALCEGTARTQRLAMGTGMPDAQVKIGPEVFEAAGKRIRHFLADLGPATEGVLHDRNGDHRCPECGEILTGA